MTDRDVLAMPLRRFWLMQTNISRLRAVEDMRMVRLHNALRANTTEDGFQQYINDLNGEIGIVHRVEEKLDREGVQRLAALA